MLIPKRVKHRKTQRGRRRGKAYRGSTVEFGSFGLKAMEGAWITNRQIESARIAINRYLRRDGKVWIRIFPDKPVTKKPAETRMGSGKGNPIFEIDGVTKERAQEAVRLASHKLPIKCKFVQRVDLGAL